MAAAYIIGASTTAFGPQPEKSIVSLGRDAALTALSDAGVDSASVNMGFFANVFGPLLFGDTTIGQDVFGAIGVQRAPIINIENACTSGSSAFHLAVQAIEADAADIVVVVGAEKMCVPTLGLVGSGQSDYASRNGMAAPVGFAMRAARHMHEFGTTLQQFAAVTVKSRAFAAKNPLAQFCKPTSVEEVLAGPMIADPLTRAQCCPIADGASAIVVASEKAARANGARAVRVNASVLTSGESVSAPDIVRWGTDIRTCALAYEKAGVGPDDVDVAECHDAFSISEILHYEALGFCAAGEGGRFVESGASAPGGRKPVNPSGGLLSRGHPVAATGVAQISEIVLHLRGEAGARQTPDAKVGVAQCMGGDKDGDTKSCTVVVLSR